jgi:hypothetical protein
MPEMQPENQPSSRARRHFLGLSAAATATLAIPLASTALANPAFVFNRNGNVYEGGDTSGQSIGQYRRRLIDRDGDGTIDVRKGTTLRNVLRDRTGTFTSHERTTKKVDKDRNGIVDRVTRRERTRTVHKGPHCFLPGTCILTSQGEVPIEDLRIGDLVVTVRGEAKPIKWIGRQSFKKSGAAWQDSVLPIRIARGALDENTPHRDLYVSPWHAFLIDGFLMPAMDLVNGTSIVPALPDEREVIDYFQLVLDTHEMVLAEGAPAETLLVTTGKEYENFADFAEYERLYGSEAGTMVPYAPKLRMPVRGREHLKALLGLGISRFVDVRDPPQKVYDRIAARAVRLAA